MSEYDKELDTRTDEYEEAMKPKRRVVERKEEEEGNERERQSDEAPDQRRPGR